MTERSGVLEKFIDALKAKFRVGHFAAAELEHNLDLHVFAQKIDRVAQFDAEVVWINFGAELDFLDLVGVLVLAGFLVLLGLFVAKFAEIHEPADGRDGVGGDLDEVHALGAGAIQGIAERKYAQLIVIRSDDPHFAGTNFTVYPDE